MIRHEGRIGIESLNLAILEPKINPAVLTTLGI
jgi:hypothetical protein